MRFSYSALQQFAASARGPVLSSVDDIAVLVPLKRSDHRLVGSQSSKLPRARAERMLKSDKELNVSVYDPGVIGLHLVKPIPSAFGTGNLLEASRKAVDKTVLVSAFFRFVPTTYAAPPIIQETAILRADRPRCLKVNAEMLDVADGTFAAETKSRLATLVYNMPLNSQAIEFAQIKSID